MTARMRADHLLVAQGFYESRAKAQEAIEAGLVLSDGVVIRKASEKIAPHTQIDAQKPYPWVSRGGLKLAHALAHFSVDPRDTACLDVGASTGGFSHVLLDHGAAEVVAVDVGHAQFHPSLRHHPRLTLFEGQDIRVLDLNQLTHRPTLGVVDVSFISLLLILPALDRVMAETAQIILLIKPQFEVGKQAIGKNGVVKDEEAQQRVCTTIAATLQQNGWHVGGVIPSPITGGDGNQEFLLYAHRGQGVPA